MSQLIGHCITAYIKLKKERKENLSTFHLYKRFVCSLHRLGLTRLLPSTQQRVLVRTHNMEMDIDNVNEFLRGALIMGFLKMKPGNSDEHASILIMPQTPPKIVKTSRKHPTANDVNDDKSNTDENNSKKKLKKQAKTLQRTSKKTKR